MKTFLNAIKKYFVDFGTAVAKGDIWCKLSLLVMGAGYWGRKQIVKGVLITALEVVVILFTGMFSINYIKDLNTLGTVQYESVFDPLTLEKILLPITITHSLHMVLLKAFAPAFIFYIYT